MRISLGLFFLGLAFVICLVSSGSALGQTEISVIIKRDPHRKKGLLERTGWGGSRDVVSLITSSWRIETARPWGEGISGDRAPAGVFGRWPTGVRPRACHRDSP